MAETFTTVLEMSTHSSPEGVEMGKIEQRKEWMTEYRRNKAMTVLLTL